MPTETGADQDASWDPASVDAAEGFGAMGLTRLQSEPARLRADARSLDAELGSLALKNHRVFVEHNDCTNFVAEQRAGVDSCLQQLVSLVHELKADGEGFAIAAQRLSRDYKRNRRTLDYHSSLLELLELPQLMDACVRKNHFDAAIGLLEKAHKVEQRHLYLHRTFYAERRTPAEGVRKLAAGQDAPEDEVLRGICVIQSIAEEMGQLSSELRARLVAVLRTSCPLNQLMSTMSALRQIDTLELERRKYRRRHAQMLQRARTALRDEDGPSPDGPRGAGGAGQADSSGQDGIAPLGQFAAVELNLQMEYLEARDLWLENLLADIRATRDMRESDAAARGFLLDVISTLRKAWFETCTQCAALFGDEYNTAAPKAGAHSQLLPASAVVSHWLQKRMVLLMNEIRQTLPQLTDAGSLRDVAGQAIYFASSAARFHADFSGTASAMFSGALRTLVVKRWVSAVNEFRQLMGGADVATELVEARVAALSEELGPAVRDAMAKFSPPARAKAPTTVLPRHLPSLVSDAAARSAVDGAEDLAASDTDTPPAAPLSLLAFPPLARLLNGLLQGINELAQWPLVQEAAPLAIHLSAALAVAMKILRGGDETQQMMRDALVSDLLPVALAAFSFIYKPGDGEVDALETSFAGYGLQKEVCEGRSPSAEGAEDSSRAGGGAVTGGGCTDAAKVHPALRSALCSLCGAAGVNDMF